MNGRKKLMKKSLLVLTLFGFASIGFASDLPMCDPSSESRVSFDSPRCFTRSKDEPQKITFITGTLAKDKFEQMKEKAFPQSAEDDAGMTINPVRKKSRDLVCGQYEVKSYDGSGRYLGPAGCSSYWCNEIEYCKP